MLLEVDRKIRDGEPLSPEEGAWLRRRVGKVQDMMADIQPGEGIVMEPLNDRDELEVVGFRYLPPKSLTK